MSKSGFDKSIKPLYLIILVLFLISGAIVVKNSFYNKSENRSDNKQVATITIQNRESIPTSIRYNNVIQTWIPNRDNFRLLTFVQIKILDNLKTERTIYLLDNIRKKCIVCPVCRDHFIPFPEKNDVIPDLS